MPITGKKIPMALDAATPTALTPENLQTQLNAIGLTCKYTSTVNLAKFIAEVKAEIADKPAASQVWGILNPNNPALTSDASSEDTLQDVLVAEDAATGNWTPQPNALGYATRLSYIMAHFDWLKTNRPAFVGVNNHSKTIKRYDSVDSIKTAFSEIAANMASVVATGLNRDAVEATMSNIIAPMDDPKDPDFVQTQSRVLYLVDDFDPNKNTADGIGALLVTWSIEIKDYKHKKEAMKYDTTMTVSAAAVEYGSIAEMNADYNAAKAHFKTPPQAAFAAMAVPGSIPARNTELKIYQDRPPADEDTFQHSLPLLATEKDSEVVVFYAPGLNNIGSIDNSKSKATTAFAKSVTTGFTFSSTQSLSIGAEFEVGAVFAKAKFSVDFTLSFTESSTKSTTETMTFTVPAGEKCFSYQGTLHAAVLTFDADRGTFQYSNSGGFQSPILVTSQTPILTSKLTPPATGS